MKLFAYYLPQFHPTPENDAWWGKGFTEWTNVAKARPLFPGHCQPKLPADLGFYDLRVVDVMRQQARMARDHGVNGFAFYHYWFGNGKLMLEKPLQQFLHNQDIDAEFCMCWANESWKGTWHGAGNRMLMEQQYGGTEDYREHFNYLLPFFRDHRQLTIDGKPVFQVYMPQNIPDLELFVSVFQEEARKNGLPGIYLMSVKAPMGWDAGAHGFQGLVHNNYVNIHSYMERTLKGLFFRGVVNNPLVRKILGTPKIIPYTFVRRCLEDFPSGITAQDWFPLANSAWDNTPRTKHLGSIFTNASPEAFADHIAASMVPLRRRSEQRQILFIRAWNEWAEGNMLEPDNRHGHAYLKAISNQLLPSGEHKKLT